MPAKDALQPYEDHQLDNARVDFSDPTTSSAFIYVTGDFTLSKSGSHIRFAQMIDYCLVIFEKVIVYSYRNNYEDPWLDDGISRFNARFPDATLVLDAQTPSLKRLFRLKNLALMIAPSRVGAILNWRIEGDAPELKRLMTQEPTLNMLINFVDGAVELNGLDIRRVHIDTHDSKFVRYAKFRGRKLWEWKSLARLRGEIAVLGAAKSMIAISQVEAGFFRVLFGDRPVHFIPSYVAPRVPHEALDGVKRIDLLFVGSNNPYNRDGLKKFIRSNDTLLHARTLAVAGSVCSDNELKVLAATYPNIRLLGWVDDLAELYRSAALVIAPVDGTGLNIKVLEALEHGKPVLASDHARHALPPGHGDCVFEIDVGTIDDFLEDPRRLGVAEKAAFEFARGPLMRGDIASLTRMLKNPERSS